MLRESILTSKMSHFIAVETWEFHIVRWVIGMNTSSIRLLWIGRTYNRSGI
jgi:hypothetical protein